MKYTPAYLQTLETLIKENAYTIRNEKGNFKSACCVLQDKRVIVVNKFATIESRINSLIEILKDLSEKETLSEDALQELKNISTVKA